MNGHPAARGRHRARAFPRYVLAGMAASLSCTGCQWQKPAAVQEVAYDPTRSTEVAVPPKELVQVVKRVMSEPPMGVGVASERDGVLLTDWKEYPGAMHIVRRWQERTRFKVTILPDFSEPLARSHIQVLDETEEKPSEQQPWYPNPELRRPERSAEVLRLIERAAKSAPGERAESMPVAP